MVASERSIEQKLASYEAARRRAVGFLLQQMNDDGSIGPVAEGIYYYRVPWAFAVSGETGAAMRVLEWVRRHMLTPEGEVAGRASPNNGANRTANTYAETCLAYGAHLLRQYDVAQRAMRFALRYQDPETGGVWMDRERTGPDGPQLLYLTAQLGMSALLTGHVAAAISAGRWLTRLLAAQPEFPLRLYTVWTRAGGLATRVPTGPERRHYLNESQEVEQYHYNGGIAAALLGRLYLYTSDPAWLEAARAYQHFSMASTERQFETKQVCKSAWGGGLLATITREPQYLEWEVRLGDWFTFEQCSDGSWTNTPYLDPNPGLKSKISITAEFIVHLDTIIGALAASTVR
jgi:hypothetical protein